MDVLDSIRQSDSPKLEKTSLTEKNLSEKNLSKTFIKFVEVQAKEAELKRQELDFKAKELEVRKKEIDSHKEIALKTIEAQTEDRKGQSDFFKGLETKNLIFKCVVTFAVVIIFGIAVFTGNAEHALELAKIGGGMFLGYVAGVYKGRADKVSSNDEND